MKVVPISILALAVSICAAQTSSPTKQQPNLGHRSAKLLTVDSLQFKDLNNNGKLDLYEDWRLSPEVRAKDLLSRMTLEELAGTMVHGTAPMPGALAPGTPLPPGSGYNEAQLKALVQDVHITSLITRLSGSGSFLAEQDNRVQELAEATRLGVPVTLSTDPRNNLNYVFGMSVQAGSFSKWPEPIGFAAIGDPQLVRHFADVVRQEYMAVGIRQALSPQADLSTEPRWTRIDGTFGEDAESAKKMVKAYIEGMQAGDSGPNPQSVLAVVKHWVGYGSQVHGWDSHFYYGRFADFPSGNFNYHIIPFTGAFEADVAGVMPTYSIIEHVSINGKPLEPVAAGFNKQLLQELLRGTYHFNGVILSDWAITHACDDECRNGAPAGKQPDFAQMGRPWGVGDLSEEDLFAKSINAGVDQIGGTEKADVVLKAEKNGKISEARMRDAVYKILLQKFEIGLFEDPYVDPKHADEVVGKAESVKEGLAAQSRAMILLENKNKFLPLAPAGKKVFLYGVDPAVAAEYGLTVVDAPEKADFAIVRTTSPFQSEHPNMGMGNNTREGRLDYRESDPGYKALLTASAKVPTVMIVRMDRPAILTNVKDKTVALLADFGADDHAALDVLTGKAHPGGHVPYELPSSMDAVEMQRSDLPHDSVNPLYPYGYGLSY